MRDDNGHGIHGRTRNDNNAIDQDVTRVVQSEIRDSPALNPCFALCQSRPPSFRRRPESSCSRIVTSGFRDSAALRPE